MCQLIEEEHATVGQAHLPRTGLASAAEQGGGGTTVVRRSKGALLLQVFDAMQMTGDGMDACDGECFLRLRAGISRGS